MLGNKEKLKTAEEKEATILGMFFLKELFKLINYKMKWDHHCVTINKLIDPSIDQKELLLCKEEEDICVSWYTVTLEILFIHIQKWTWIWWI